MSVERISARSEEPGVLRDEGLRLMDGYWRAANDGP